MRRLSLVNRLLALALAACLPGLAALIYSAIDLRNTRYSEVHAEALRNARFTVSEVDQIFEGIEGTLHAISQSDEVKHGDPITCSSYLARVRVRLPQLTSILILDNADKPRCSSADTAPLINVADRYYLREARATKEFAVGNYVASRSAAIHIVPVALPALSGDDIEFVVSAGLNLEWLGSQLLERGVVRGGAITIADRNGVIVAREPAHEKFIGTSFPTEEMYLLSSQPGTADVHSSDGVDRIVGFVPAPVTPFGLYVSSGIAKRDALEPVDRAFRNSILLFFLGTVGTFALAWLVGDTIIRRPLMRMVATAEAWRRGEDNVRTGLSDRNDEIGILGQTFDRLMDENKQREKEREVAEAQREILVHELAHRVKNTLATVQSIASLSFRNSQGPEALTNFHERLQALVRSHDLLTRHHWENADLIEVLEAALAPVREDHAHRFTLSGPQVRLLSNIVVPIAMIFHELCTNSMKYGALSNDRGTVMVTWTAQLIDEGTRVSLIWVEQGGPLVKPPERQGFGTRLIDSLTKQMNGTIESRFPPSGFICNVRFVVLRETAAKAETQ